MISRYTDRQRSTLRHADDTTLFATSAQHFEELLSRMEWVSCGFGLIINRSKTKMTKLGLCQMQKGIKQTLWKCSAGEEGLEFRGPNAARTSYLKKLSIKQRLFSKEQSRIQWKALDSAEDHFRFGLTRSSLSWEVRRTRAAA